MQLSRMVFTIWLYFLRECLCGFAALREILLKS